jgi:MFS family permease
LDSTGYGLLMSFSAVGGLLGTFLAPRLRKKVGYAPGIVAALTLGAASITLCGLTSNVGVAGLALAAYICHAVVWNVLAGTVRQKIVPPDLLGRTGAVGRLAAYLGIAFGAGVGGWLASGVGLRGPFVLSGALFVVCVVLAVRLSPAIRAWQALEDEPSAIAS